MANTRPRYAPFWSRVLAQNLDLLVLLAPAYLLSTFINHDIIFYLLMLCLYLAYHTIAEISSWRGSLGKKLMRMEVTSVGGEAYMPQKAFVRNISKILSLILCSAGFLMAAFNRRHQTLHDKISGSVVIIPLQ